VKEAKSETLRKHTLHSFSCEQTIIFLKKQKIEWGERKRASVCGTGRSSAEEGGYEMKERIRD
jgi:hypothetical protein